MYVVKGRLLRNLLVAAEFLDCLIYVHAIHAGKIFFVFPEKICSIIKSLQSYSCNVYMKYNVENFP